jgi:hypothetical protein
MLRLQSQVAEIKPSRAAVREMFFFLHGPKIRRGLAAVFFGFLDSSNTHAGAKVWTLCGFLGDEPAFEPLDRAWNGVLDKPYWPKRIERFHTVECVHGYGEFEGWPFAERLTMWGELISVLTSLPLVALGSVIITEDFGKLEPDELELLRSEGLGDPLDLSLQYILQRSISLTRQTSESESIGLLFDNENPTRSQRCHEFCDLYRTKFGFDKWLAGIGFGSSMKWTPLQAADLLAYGTYQFTMKRYPQIREPDFPIMPGFLRMIEGVLHDGGGFDLDSMKLLASEIRKRHSQS